MTSLEQLRYKAEHTEALNNVGVVGHDRMK